MANITGNSGNNSLNGTNANDTITGDDEPLIVEGGKAGKGKGKAGKGGNIESVSLGNDNIDGGAGNDIIFGDTGTGGDISLSFSGKGKSGKSGKSGSITFNTGDDTIRGGAGADIIDGEGGNDTIIVDEIGDGYGDIVDGGTNATLTVIQEGKAGKGKGKAGKAGKGGDTTTTVTDNNDFDTLDLSGSAELGVVRIEVNSSTDSDGNGLDGTVRWIDSQTGATLGTLNFENIENIIVPCLAAETQIMTNIGNVQAGDIAVGDMVLTVDNGFKPVQWVGKRTVSGTGSFAPILIEAGALGNTRNMLVSPLHQMLVKNAQNEMLFGENEVLVPAKFLVNGSTIRQVNAEKITYVHVMFDQHEIIFAESAMTETFHPGQQGIGAFEEEARDELFELFPELCTEDGIKAYGKSARRCLKKYEAALLQA
jgi:hypothetical protein